MADYIDRNLLAECVDSHNNVHWDDIANTPSEDVQPVVRCRDCSVPVGGFCGKLGGYPPDKDFYCAFGISKDGGT